MKTISKIAIVTSIVLGVLFLTVYGFICLVGWKIALALLVALFLLILWIGYDIHHCAVEDENGNLIVPSRKEREELDDSEELDKI